MDKLTQDNIKEAIKQANKEMQEEKRKKEREEDHIFTALILLGLILIGVFGWLFGTS